MHGAPMTPEPVAADRNAGPQIDSQQAKVLGSLKVDEGLLLDDLMECLPYMSSSEIIAALFQLEMDGLVRQDVGQRYRKIW